MYDTNEGDVLTASERSRKGEVGNPGTAIAANNAQIPISSSGPVSAIHNRRFSTAWDGADPVRAIQFQRFYGVGLPDRKSNLQWEEIPIGQQKE